MEGSRLFGKHDTLFDLCIAPITIEGQRMRELSERSETLCRFSNKWGNLKSDTDCFTESRLISNERLSKYLHSNAVEISGKEIFATVGKRNSTEPFFSRGTSIILVVV